MRRGFLITLEGPEGAGKSTHARRLAAWLTRRGHRVLLTREPGGTPLGNRLRRILLAKRRGHLEPLFELFLYEASRALLVYQVIRPALKKGKIVVADRFQDSSWVYQGWAGGVSLPLVECLGEAATGGLKPDLTLVLDLPAAKGLSRVVRPNRMEGKPLAFHWKVRQGFLALAKRRPRRIRVVRAEGPPDLVQQYIRKEVAHLLKSHRK